MSDRGRESQEGWTLWDPESLGTGSGITLVGSPPWGGGWSLLEARDEAFPGPGWGRLATGPHGGQVRHGSGWAG